MFTTDAKIKTIIGNDYPKIVIPAIKEAKSTIDIIMYEWKLYTHEKGGGVSDLTLSLIDRARSKVNIRVLLNIESFSHPITKINSRTASYLQEKGVKIKFGNVGVVTHAKMVIIDKKVAIVGSHNYSKASFTKNHECSVYIEGAEAIREYVDFFNLLWNRY